MAIGKEVGTFSTNSTSITSSVDANGDKVFVMNYEGTVSGGWNGMVLSTLTARSSDFQTGTYTANVTAYLDDGQILTGEASGLLKSLGGHKWQLNGVDLVSDGSRIASEGVMSLADRNFSGTLSEIS